MKLINFGGATALMEHNGKRFLFDPWLDDGIFHNSWHHFPPLHLSISDVGRVDYIYLSHIHEDHCSAGTLKHLDKNATIIIMDRKPNFVLNFLRRNHNFGFKEVVCLKPNCATELETGIIADILPGDPQDEMAHIIDSTLILKWDGRVIVNANDCLPYKSMIDYIIETYGSPELALLPYAGGSGYPSCYTNLSDDEKRSESNRIRHQRISNFIETIIQLNPKFAMPFADQYVVVGSRREFNKYVGHPPSPAAVKEEMQDAGLSDRLLLLTSGQQFDLDTGYTYPVGNYPVFTETDRLTYAENHSNGLYHYEKFDFSYAVPIDRLIKYARDKLWEHQNRRNSFPDWFLVFEIEGTDNPLYIINLKENSVLSTKNTELPEMNHMLKIKIQPSLFILLVIGHISWNVADASLFLDYHRVPNEYNPEVYVLLNFLKV